MAQLNLVRKIVALVFWCGRHFSAPLAEDKDFLAAAFFSSSEANTFPIARNPRRGKGTCGPRDFARLVHRIGRTEAVMEASLLAIPWND